MLTVDLGNTRAKLRLWGPPSSGAPPALLDSLEIASADTGALEPWLAGRRPHRAALSSVNSSARTAPLVAELSRRVDELWVAPAPPLENRCLSPERVGLDRLYAAAGAAARLGRSCAVVDLGTALTVDALLVEGERRAFLGGAIAPGPELLAAALAGGTARLPRVEPRPGARALGRITEEALLSGVVVGLRGAAERLVSEVTAEAGIPAAPVVLTGGGRDFLLQPGPFVAGELWVEPDLVHLGLLAALEAALARGQAGRR